MGRHKAAHEFTPATKYKVVWHNHKDPEPAGPKRTKEVLVRCMDCGETWYDVKKTHRCPAKRGKK
jgi:uncharacterized Zn finger protein